MTTLPERLRRIRGDQLQREFAVKLNTTKVPESVPPSRIHQAMISRYERGQEMPSAWTLYRMARASNTTIEWLLTGEEKETSKC